MFVAIEGVNGVGKSSVVELLEREMGFIQHTPPDWLMPAMHQMNRPADVEARHLLITAAMAHASVRIREFVESGRDVAVSGYIRRTELYHRVMGSQLTLDLDAILYQPTATILLDCREPERRERIRRRGRPRELWDDLVDRRIEQLREEYSRLGWPRVDTTHLSVRAAFEQVRRIVLQAREGAVNR